VLNKEGSRFKMKIIVKNNDEKKVLETLLKQLEYTWSINDEDGYQKAFEYVNDRTECWKDETLVIDYKPLLRKILKNIGKVSVEIES
jgi:hypothetical protein